LLYVVGEGHFHWECLQVCDVSRWRTHPRDWDTGNRELT